MQTAAMIDDKDLSFLELCQQRRASIISQLVEIGSKRNQQKHSKLLHFIHHLECLRPENTRLYRASIDAFRNSQYVALSYTWDPSEYESARPKKYCVQSWSRNRFRRSKVRNCVFDRIFRYMRHNDVPFLWIDRYCIPQGTCKTPCAHARCAQKRDNIQAMDLVYQRSGHPVALLGRPLRTRAELQLLTRILSGDLVDKGTDLRDATAALWLLHEITQDRWWRRAWTFQENYRAGERMRLLIRHHPSLEQQKLQYPRFGEIPGELCVASVLFSKQATRLCLQLKEEKVARRLSQDDISRIQNILQAAGRYEFILDRSSAMTPRVVADIESREAAVLWDRLALVANCCQYSVRLDYIALGRQHCSLSLSILAMCLLNGEILNNSNNWAPAANLTMSEFLERQIFWGLNAPKKDARRLTFNKGCRLPGVELRADGIVAQGHLWELGLIIDTKKFTQEAPWTDESSSALSRKQRKHLLQLLFYLRKIGHRPYADWIDKHLTARVRTRSKRASFAKRYIDRMAGELADAIGAGEKLRLGSIWDPKRRLVPGYAIFVWSGEDSNGADPSPPAFVFTSKWPRDPGSEAHDANDIDRHVSFRVDLENPLPSRVPRLRVRSWLLGICFFYACPRTRVVFPWPQGLQELKEQRSA